MKNFTLNFLTYKNGTSYMLLCLDPAKLIKLQCLVIIYWYHHVCCGRHRKKGRTVLGTITIVTGDDRRPTTEKIHAVSIFILPGSTFAFYYFTKVSKFLVPNIKSWNISSRKTYTSNIVLIHVMIIKLLLNETREVFRI